MIFAVNMGENLGHPANVHGSESETRGGTGQARDGNTVDAYFWL